MIGWYIHHQGRGHLTRAMAVCASLDEPVVALSSLPRPVGDGFADWVALARDDSAGPFGDPTADGLLHWAPLGHDGLARRNAAIAHWISARRPRLMVVDVSVEVTALARLCGAPVVVVAGPGDRHDSPHQLAYGLAEHIVAAWPQEVYDPPFLHPHAGKTSYVGAFSRFDGLTPAPAQDQTAVVLTGAGGANLTAAQVADAQAAVRGLDWTALGLPGGPWSEDVWSRLSAAAVVITHGGQNAVAESAAAARPTVVVAQPRPFGEQHALAAALHEHGIAIGLACWPERRQWPAVIDAALALDGAGWSRWADGAGAARAAAVIAASRPAAES